MTDNIRALVELIDVVLAEADARNLKPIKLKIELDDLHAEVVHPPHQIRYSGPVPAWPGRVIASPVMHWDDTGPRVEPPPVAVPKPASWWRRILGRPR
jgi:hypothetical protein